MLLFLLGPALGPLEDVKAMCLQCTMIDSWRQSGWSWEKGWAVCEESESALQPLDHNKVLYFDLQQARDVPC